MLIKYPYPRINVYVFIQQIGIRNVSRTADITKIIFGTKSYKYYEYRPFILKYMNDINKDFGIQDLEISKIKIR